MKPVTLTLIEVDAVGSLKLGRLKILSKIVKKAVLLKFLKFDPPGGSQ